MITNREKINYQFSILTIFFQEEGKDKLVWNVEYYVELVNAAAIAEHRSGPFPAYIIGKSHVLQTLRFVIFLNYILFWHAPNGSHQFFMQLFFSLYYFLIIYSILQSTCSSVNHLIHHFMFHDFLFSIF